MRMKVWDPARRLVCVLRGGGDLATGVAWQLWNARLGLIVLELPEPLTVRRTVALSTAVHDGEARVQGMRGLLVGSPREADMVAREGGVAVLVCPDLAAFHPVRPDVLVDARMAKSSLDTSILDAGLVIGLGPGFTVGVECHAVVETMRGPDLGRVITSGRARPDTGTPADLGGRSVDRVVRAPVDGRVEWRIEIGDVVDEGRSLGSVGGVTFRAPFRGVVRGAVREGMLVRAGFKIGDVDPRGDPTACWRISDKASAVGRGVLEAVERLALRTGPQR